ncbi:hypothetical protein ACKKBG_A03340 [Auxenochlorella protothecoides x Auxenochlorella symbiontica]
MASSQRDGENVHPSAPRVVEPRQYPLQSLPSNQIFSPEAFRTPQHKYSSSTPAPDPIARLVDLQTRHAALLDGIEQAQRSAEQLGKICMDREAAADAAEARLQEATEQLQGTSKELSGLQEEYEATSALLARCAEGLAAQHTALETAEVSAAEAETQAQAAQTRRAEAEAGAQSAQRELDALAERVAALRGESAELEAAGADKAEALRRQLAEESAAAQQQIASCVAEGEARLRGVQAQASDAAQQAAESVREAEQAQAQLEETNSQLAETTCQLSEARHLLAAAQEETTLCRREAQQSLGTLEADVARLRGEAVALEARVVTLGSRLAELSAACRAREGELRDLRDAEGKCGELEASRRRGELLGEGLDLLRDQLACQRETLAAAREGVAAADARARAAEDRAARAEERVARAEERAEVLLWQQDGAPGPSGRSFRPLLQHRDRSAGPGHLDADQWAPPMLSGASLSSTLGMPEQGALVPGPGHPQALDPGQAEALHQLGAMRSAAHRLTRALLLLISTPAARQLGMKEAEELRVLLSGIPLLRSSGEAEAPRWTD